MSRGFDMKITQGQLRQIIREEVARSMDEMDLSVGVPYIAGGRRRMKGAAEPRERPSGPMPDDLRKLNDDRTALQVLRRALSKIDEDYVTEILPAPDRRGEMVKVADWAGPELETKIKELANDFWMSGSIDPEAAFEELKALVDQYSPLRGRQDFLGTATRFASNLGRGIGLDFPTKESLKRR